MPLDEATPITHDRLRILVDVDEALNRLAAIDPRRARVVELRYFGGMTVDETAEILEIAPITVTRNWNFAKAWLHSELLKDT